MLIICPETDIMVHGDHRYKDGMFIREERMLWKSIRLVIWQVRSTCFI